jgi:carbon-monoxide dehydrogenase medium subunit/2-furoyl-CoA dehydrogenase FAD binding subunit
MKPVPFEYFDPATKDEAFKLLDDLGDDAKLLAGGQSLLPMMNYRLARPKYLIDINKVHAMDHIREDNGHIYIGALTRERSIEESELIKSKIPILAEAASRIGFLPIRNKGTIGGSIAHADPSAELCLMMQTLEAQIKVESSEDSRWIDAEDFFLTYLTTALQPNEMITEIKIPIPPAGTVRSFQSFSWRQGDFAIVSVAIMLAMNKDGICEEATIGLGGVNPTPFRATDAEEILKGKRIDEALMDEAAHKASEAADPDYDIHSSAEYKREMARVFTKKGLIEALERYEEKQ